MVLLSDEVVADMKANGPRYEQWLERDERGRPFLHYLYQYSEYDPMVKLPGTVVMEEPAARVVDFLCHRLNTDSGDVFDKDKWFQDYWNRTVSSRGVFGRIEQGVVERVATFGPTIVVRRMLASA